MPRSRFRLTSLVLLSSAFVILPVIDKPLHAQSSSSLMDAMSAELSRATSSLGKDAKDGQQPPYYLSYSAHDVFTVALTAQQGALLNDDSGHQRVVDVVVRVGDPRLDNTHGTHRTSAITTIPLPLEDDSKAIRRSLWWATNTGYGNALQSYLQVKTETEVRAKEEDTSPDFSKDPASSAAGQPVVAPQVDKQEWGQRLRSLSNIFRDYPHVYSNFVMLNVQDETGYFVSSEGAKIVDPHRSARLVVFASTRAADGMDLFRAETFEAETISGLPAQKEMEAAIHRLGASLEDLRDAPVTQPFDGPAILSGRAAAVFFHEVLGHRLEGQRQRGDQEGQTFTKDIGKPILPSFLSVADDPTMTTFEGTSLSGYYSYDDEGQRAQKVNLIQDGVLKTFLMSRLPIASFANSNGHGRAQIGLMPTGRQGNLIVTSTKTVPEKTLRKMLIDEAKKQNKPYGLYFEDISSGFAVTTRNAPQAFQVIPLVVYRVYTDGRPDELVRGVSIVGTPQAALNRIFATGDKREVFNGECGAESGTIPVSAIAPAMLVSEIETQRQQQGISRPPILPPPTAKASGEVQK
ncbi:putative Zn-dependent protease [Silvibacterium bohemicum]|uniref:Putative Zn-dependent protease n=1 Tax=Silvibacterium bohemicum TaxID=1577686 RepID=A0A841JVT7_9BACT|nr:metallopeptidase TldD-related protein [Silvibacterium bohemicum]MBB6145513.1 putative Zn-dependent protease [Silvibacterium bohemicum]